MLPMCGAVQSLSELISSSSLIIKYDILHKEIKVRGDIHGKVKYTKSV